MSRLIAFLRAINVGGHTVKMGRLREIFESLELQEVETFIASGNVIFGVPNREIAALEDEIAAQLQEHLGYEVDTFIRTGSELAKVSAYTPFVDMQLAKGGDTLCVGFVGTPLSKAARGRLLEYRSEIDDFHVKGREIYWLRHRAKGKSKFSNGTLEKTIEAPATFRNINTVNRLVVKYSL